MWKYTLIDNSATETEVEDPLGWEDIEVSLTRDATWRGIFFGYLIDKLEFSGIGAQLIKDEWEINGISGEMNLRIEFLCGDPGIYTIFYEGKLSFVQYESTCGDECLVTIGIEDTGDIMLMRNNYQTDVNLNNNIAFDGVTSLTDYDKLNYALTVPSRGILQKSAGSNTEKQTTNLLDFLGWGSISGSGTGTEQGGVMPVFTNITLSEIDTTSINTTPFYEHGTRFNDGTNSHPTTPFIELVDSQTLKCAPAGIRVEMRLKGRLIDNSNATRSVDFATNIATGPNGANVTIIDTQFLASYSVGAFQTTEFDVSFDGIVQVAPGDNIYIYEIITYFKTSSAVIQQLIIEWDTESFIRFTGTSYCDPTEVKTYLINEAVSRTIEAITNNQIKFYSTYFGRTDSQPYTIGNNPCAGLFAITNGLNLRNRVLADNTQPGFFVTLKALFDELNSLYNIGLTIEPDINRPGFNRLRFEDWRYFFQDDVGLIFNDATLIRTKVDESRIFNRLTAGYNKWTAGQFTGLDEFMTKRKYRININAIDKELDVSTNMICSTYTIEITRRLDQTTEDWQYDNDIFGFCLNDDYEIALFTDPDYGSYGIVNVLDPDSCYNGRISPERCAMRWFNYIIQGIRVLGDNSILIFTNGEGNYIAEYGIKLCNIEGDVLTENQTITIEDFEDITNAKPVTFPETLTFDHPLNWNTFIRILREPDLKYKSVLVKCNGVNTQGWINSLQYKPNAGTATIVVIPKNTSIIPTPIPPAGCEASIVPGSIVVVNYYPGIGSATFDWTDDQPGATLWSFIITRGSVPAEGSGISGTTTMHPFTIPAGLEPGTWSVFIVPYCDAQNVGTNYAEGTFDLPAPPAQIIELRAYRLSGGPENLDTFKLNGVVLGPDNLQNAFSFKFGGCMTGTGGVQYCNGYPTAPYNPTLFATFTMNAGSTVAEKKFSFNTGYGGSLDKVVIFGMVGIDSSRIVKAAGETWTLEFE
jgi:hypothetical protein